MLKVMRSASARALIGFLRPRVCSNMPISAYVARQNQPASACFAPRSLSTSMSLRGDCNTLMKLKEKQALFQCDDGLLVWEKGGMTDKALYGITLLLCAFGVFNVLAVLYDQAKPKSWVSTKKSC